MIAALIGALRPQPQAQAEDGVFDAWAQWVTRRGRWAGATTHFPAPLPRPPEQPLRLASMRWPLWVHAAKNLDPERVEAVLGALEYTLDWLDAHGWPLPYPDGGRGQSPGFDVYLAPGAARGASAGLDAPIEWSGLDAAATFAVIDADGSRERVERCASAALVQAILLGLDPAEAEHARIASSELVLRTMGHADGCDVALEADPRAPETPQAGIWGDGEARLAATVAWLDAVSRRHDGHSGDFIRDVWQLARQRSDSGDELRASPSLLEAFDRALANAGESLERSIADAAAGWLMTHSQYHRTVASTRHTIDWSRLPRHLPVSEPPLGDFGSATFAIETPGAAEGDRLEVWLRAESDARWALWALRVAADGRELGRVSSPPRRGGRAFLPVELSAGTAGVRFLVIKYPKRRDGQLGEPGDLEHYFKLIVDRGR
ncbi:MAG: hypothetical protein OEZ06_08990 [Myxococcales bacterium]|nr:hypothetical protein [Myxococcales bacterium]